MGNPAMGGGENRLQALRDRLNAVRLNMGGAPSPSTGPITGMAPSEGLIGGMVNRPEIGRSPQVGEPLSTPPAPAPVNNPGVVSNILRGGVTGRGGAVTTPQFESPASQFNSFNPMVSRAPRKKPRNKAFTMPAPANKGMIY